ncbi:unnamed protein product [Schistocephalus solidus]|uniref:Uncharacterized protein n=1 Tax=Schistocephalus solidus TaxID=70667 RepID=A0A183TMC7_SCHSO|nr:unnamed protein product [Schistocephalus solidus]
MKNVRLHYDDPRCGVRRIRRAPQPWSSCVGKEYTNWTTQPRTDFLAGLCLRMLNFADQNRLFVTNTCFQHHHNHLLTWDSNEGHTASQSDYILVCSRLRSWVYDSRSMLGAESGNAHGSEPVLVRTCLKVHLSSAPEMPLARRLDVAKNSANQHYRGPEHRNPIQFYDPSR